MSNREPWGKDRRRTENLRKNNHAIHYAEDLKSFQYRFESDWGHNLCVKYGAQQGNTPALNFQCIHKCIHNLEGFEDGYVVRLAGKAT